MSTKTKLLSLLILGLLILPVVLNSNQPGRVLGINEDRSPSVSNEESREGEIAGGVIEKRSKEKPSESESITGIALLDKDSKTSVISNKFALASEIEVTYKQNSLDLIVSQNDQNLPENVILILDTETFSSLGGNPDTDSQIEVKVTKVN